MNLLLAFCLLVLLLGPSPGSAAVCASVKSTCTNASTRAEQALHGLLTYFWKADPVAASINLTIKFFFACGQIGGVDIGHPSECTCVSGNPDSCTNCFRWYDAVILEAVANYGIYANTMNNSQVPQTMFAHSPYNANWNAKDLCTYIDDFSWYGLAYLRVYEWLKVIIESVTHTKDKFIWCQVTSIIKDIC